MKLNDLKPAKGSKKSRRRLGRGLGSGRGKTAGRGQKGQKSRSGFSQMAGWEGGRSRLVMRLPKRGFTHPREEMQIVNLDDLNVFEAGATVSAETLAEHGRVRHPKRPVKLLGGGELEVDNLTVELDGYSRSAVQAVEARGGTLRGAPRPETASETASEVTDGDADGDADERSDAPADLNGDAADEEQA